ncbi:hypothetical protein PoB_005820100 [Plakobranchus ocellatus]|uniref:Uncharacterized protein n=1 Tax=Plakobranchus ocellatus TaxID=259542 RepID=A0AAV4CJL3_9GAST|nr:hypothetical protein PoB_005820100 [Plakobranchus ocellatus]
MDIPESSWEEGNNDHPYEAMTESDFYKKPQNLPEDEPYDIPLPAAKSSQPREITKNQNKETAVDDDGRKTNAKIRVGQQIATQVVKTEQAIGNQMSQTMNQNVNNTPDIDLTSMFTLSLTLNLIRMFTTSLTLRLMCMFTIGLKLTLNRMFTLSLTLSLTRKNHPDKSDLINCAVFFGKQREKLIEGLTDWLKAGKSLEAIEATKDRKKWRTMIANAVKQGT